MNPAAYAVLIVLLAGGATALQAPTNARLAQAAQSPVNAAFVSFLVGTIALGVAAAALDARPDWGAVENLPPWAWLGGLYGTVVVVAAAWATPRLGVATTITLLVAGQLLLSLALDHFGAMGAPRHPINIGRFAGVMLVLAGVLLVRRS